MNTEWEEDDLGLGGFISWMRDQEELKKLIKENKNKGIKETNFYSAHDYRLYVKGFEDGYNKCKQDDNEGTHQRP